MLLVGIAARDIIVKEYRLLRKAKIKYQILCRKNSKRKEGLLQTTTTTDFS